MIRLHVRAAGFSTRAYSAEAAHIKKATHVVIPPAVKRGPVDMLRALSETVGVDPTAPHFGFIDDPAMIPSTAANKRNYYLAKEMGKRAARQLAEEWPTLFAFDRDEPYLPAFRPQKPADPLQVAPTEENILSMIEKRRVQDAVVLYERMQSENIEISQTTQALYFCYKYYSPAVFGIQLRFRSVSLQHDWCSWKLCAVDMTRIEWSILRFINRKSGSHQMELFKLVTYYNSKDIPFSEWEVWHGLRMFGEDEPNKWTSVNKYIRQAGVAELLFETLPRTTETVSILISGLIKFATPESISRAKELHEEFSGDILYREAYEALISVSSWKDAQLLVKEMVTKKLRPSLGTWHSLLLAASKINNITDRLVAFEKVFGEVMSLSSVPSLYAFHIVFHSMSESLFTGEMKDDGKQRDAFLRTGVSWISEVLSELESRPLIEPNFIGDHLFFLDAMAIIYHAGNLEIAERIVRLYESSANKVKMPALTAEGIFYNRYLLLFMERTTSMEQVEKKYKELVPRLVGVSRQLTLALADKLKGSPRWTLLQRLIEDGICARQTVDFRVAQTFRDLLMGVQYQALSLEHREEYADVIKRLVDIWIEFSRFTDDKHKRLQLKLSPSVISECALLLNRIGDSKKAYRLLEMLLNPEASEGEEATVLNTGYARHSAMYELFEDALRERDPFKAAICLEIMSSSMTRNKLEPLVQKIHDRYDDTGFSLFVL
uniref:Pentatricopeptide repeat protein n=1 Tax=Angiostrongylus cantonensis TaxID=6313 RepID=A0A0K0CVN4_ANGCA